MTGLTSGHDIEITTYFNVMTHGDEDRPGDRSFPEAKTSD